MELKTPADLTRLLQDFTREDGPETFRYKIYCRKSTDDGEKQQRSLKDQVAECEEFAEREGLVTIGKPYEESESAKEAGIRPVFRLMLEEIQQGKYDGIIAWHPDRLSRNMMEAGKIIDLLDKIIIKDLRFPSFTFNNDANGKLLLGITFAMSKGYSDNLSKNVSRGNNRKLLEGGYPGKAKFGYKKDRNDLLVPDGDNFILISEAFKRRLNNEKLDTIASFLAEKGLTRTNSKNGKTYKTKVDKQVVSKILRDPFYAGVLVYGKEIHDLTQIYNFTPILGVEEFMQINQLRDENQMINLALKSVTARKGRVTQLLPKKVYCEDCGEFTTPNIPKGKTKSYYYFTCQTIGCPRRNKGTRAKVVIDFVKNYLNSKPFSNERSYTSYAQTMKKELSVMYQKAKKELHSDLVKLTNAEKDLEKVLKSLYENEDKDIKRAIEKSVKEKTIEIETLKNRINEAKDLINRKEEVILSYSEFLELFKDMANTIAKTKKETELNELVGKIFSNFLVNSKNVVSYRLNKPFDALEDLSSQKVFDGAR